MTPTRGRTSYAEVRPRSIERKREAWQGVRHAMAEKKKKPDPVPAPKIKKAPRKLDELDKKTLKLIEGTACLLYTSDAADE